MAISFNHPWLLLLLPLLFYPVCLWYRDSRHLLRFRRNLALGMRTVLLLSLVLALAGLQLRFEVDKQSVIFAVDMSASCEKSKAEAETFIQAALKNKEIDDQAGMVVFGANSRVEQSLSGNPLFHSLESLVDRDYSNLQEGLELSQALLPDSTRQRIVLLSDGRQNNGDALSEAELLRSKNIRVDVLPLSVPSGPDTSIKSLEVPQKILAGEKFPVKIRINSDINTTMKLRLYRDQQLINEDQVKLSQGENLLVYSSLIDESGFFSFRVDSEADRDTVPENNAASAFTIVEGVPQVLLVEGSPGEGTAIKAALESLQLKYQSMAAPQMPVTLAELQRFGAVILCNVPAEDLREESMEAVHTAVRDLGMGLIMVGGEDSYGPGGYFKTPVEKALPVYMDLRGKKEIPSLGLLLVIDKSGSMTEGSGGFTKIDLAKEAALQSTEILGPLDQVGVIAFDDASQWVVKLQKVANREAIQDDIATIRADGGTNIFPALNLAYSALKDIKTKYKHIILLTDGQSATSGDYYFLARRMEKAGITMSTVAVGQGADQLLLEQLAEWGRGRYYFSEDLYSIPRIFTKETIKAMKNYLVEEPCWPMLTAGSPVMEGIGGIPRLDGYVATTAKKNAQVVLSSPQGDPVLAQWQYGLGRCVAFTSDAGGRWAAPWVGWPDYNRFWGNLISWTFPRHEQDNGLRLESSVKGNQGFIRLESNELSISRPTRAVVVNPDLERQEVQLEAVAPGRYEGSFALPGPGVYFINVTQQGAGRQTGTASAGLALSYSPEYNPAGADRKFLQQLAQAGGGAILSDPQAAFADNLPPVKGMIELWPWLLILAAFILPLDIAARRLNFTPADLSRLGRRSLSRIKPDLAEDAANPTLDRLRDRKREINDWRQEKKQRETGFSAGSKLSGPAPGSEIAAAHDKPIEQEQPGMDDKDQMSRLLAAKRRAKKEL